MEKIRGEPLFHCGFGLLPVEGGISQDLHPRGLALHEHAFLENLVVILCIVVRFLHAQPGFDVVGAVGHDHLARLGIDSQQLGSIEKARVTFHLAHFAQDERRNASLFGRCVLYCNRINDGNLLLWHYFLHEAFSGQHRFCRIAIISKAIPDCQTVSSQSVQCRDCGHDKVHMFIQFLLQEAFVVLQVGIQ